MFQHYSKSSEEQNEAKEIEEFKAPGLVTGYIDSADIPAERPGTYTEQYCNYHPPLPGMEEYCPQELPLEFNNSSESLTETINRILLEPSSRDLNSLEHWQREALWQWEEENGQGVGACLNVFPSGEITGSCYSLGRKVAPGRKGKLVSTIFTKQARKTIRRAVESKVTTFKLFVSLTFDPKIAQLNESGQVNQLWAKKEFKRFLNTIKKTYDRLAEKSGKELRRISYIWVAEIQEENTKNIHFHILLDQPFIPVQWLVKIWGQAPNSVNVKKLNNQEHAVNYILKYMKKGNSPIEGKRYGMTQNLIEGSKPVKLNFYGRGKRNAFLKIKEAHSWEIEQNGGRILDWGLYIPPPKRERQWRDKQGNIRTTKGTSRKIGLKLRKEIENEMAGIEKALEILNCIDSTNCEVPF